MEDLRAGNTDCRDLFCGSHYRTTLALRHLGRRYIRGAGGFLWAQSRSILRRSFCPVDVLSQLDQRQESFASTSRCFEPPGSLLAICRCCLCLLSFPVSWPVHSRSSFQSQLRNEPAVASSLAMAADYQSLGAREAINRAAIGTLYLVLPAFYVFALARLFFRRKISYHPVFISIGCFLELFICTTRSTGRSSFTSPGPFRPSF